MSALVSHLHVSLQHTHNIQCSCAGTGNACLRQTPPLRLTQAPAGGCRQLPSRKRLLHRPALPCCQALSPLQSPLWPRTTASAAVKAEAALWPTRRCARTRSTWSAPRQTSTACGRASGTGSFQRCLGISTVSVGQILCLCAFDDFH